MEGELNVQEVHMIPVVLHYKMVRDSFKTQPPVDWRFWAHHTKSLRILCNVYSSGIKTHEFCAFWGSSAESCLLSSAKL